MATPLTEEEKKLANAGIVNSGPSPLTPEELALFNESVTQEENNVAPENEVNLINSA